MSHKKLLNKSFLKLSDFTKTEIEYLLNLSKKLKNKTNSVKEKKQLKGKNIVLIFEKSSTRTRSSFEVAAYQQGANTTYLSPSNSQFGYKETVEDSARVLGKMYDAIAYRGYSQQDVEKIAKYSGIPVWNGLTDEFHPTQILADFLTIIEHSDKPLSSNILCYLGNANNNVTNSLMIGSAIMGMDFRIIAPKQYQPENKYIELANSILKKSAGKLTISEDIENTIKGVDFVYTDVWLSMGEPEKEWEKRINNLSPYQVNKEVLELTGNKNVMFLHCLPAFHNKETAVGKKIFEKYGIEALEVTNEVFESKHSVVFEQAGNRLHTIKAVMLATLGNK